jgi:hypothetical protein
LTFSSLPKETDASLVLRPDEFAIHYDRADGEQQQQQQNDAMNNLKPGGLTGGTVWRVMRRSCPWASTDHDYCMCQPVTKSDWQNRTFTSPLCTVTRLWHQ